MAEFAVFIAPNNNNYGSWQRRVGFGDALGNGRCSGLVHLEAAANVDTSLFAAFAGKLSVRQPTGFLEAAVDSLAGNAPSPGTISLYLQPVTAKLLPEWFVVSDRIVGAFQSAASAFATVDVLADFVYHHVDAQAAKAALAPKLRAAAGRNADQDALWNRFLAGEGPAIKVKAGDLIGSAGALQPGGSLRVAVGLRTAFGMYDPGQFYADIVAALPLIQRQPPPNAAALAAGPLSSQRPLIDPTRSVASVGSDRLWPWSALMQYRRTNQLPYSQWRALADAQKQLYLKQLLARARPALANPATPRFVYDVDDLANVVQLEATVEFYANFPEPWQAAAQPVAPGAAYRTVNFLGLYGANASAAGNRLTLDDQLDMTRVFPGRDTIELFADTVRPGKQYRIMGVDRARQEVTLDAAPQIGAGSGWRIYDQPRLVLIDAFGSRVRGTKAVNVAQNQLELRDLTASQLADLAQVNRFETVDLLDVGTGKEHAARLTKEPQLDQARGTALLDLDRPLAAAVAGNAWAIPSGVGGVQQATVNTVIRDKDTNERTPSAANLRPKERASVWGFDHYDGVMFMVASGEIRCHFPWTSFTSRKLDGARAEGVPARCHSSIRGNIVYRYASAFSSNLYINVGFRVVDPDGILWGTDANPVISGATTRISFGSDAKPEFVKEKMASFMWPATPRFTLAMIRAPAASQNPSPALGDLFLRSNASLIPASPAPYWILVHPGVREAHYYFTDNNDPDVCPTDKLPTDSGAPREPPLPSGDAQLGKSGIFIHKGERTRSGSEGCQVSPSFMSLRAAMVSYDAEMNASFYSDPAAKPAFQGELHWQVHKPELLDTFIKKGKELEELEKELAKITDPMKTIIDAVVRKKGNAAAKLADLRKHIERAEAQSKVAAEKGEGPSQQEVVDTLQAILDGAADGDVVALLKAEQQKRATELALRTSPVAQKITEVKAARTAEIARYGWNDALQGEYWVIRPDQRPAP